VIPKFIFWSLMFVNIVLNAFHGVVLGWADYPRPGDAPKMAELRGSGFVVHWHFNWFLNIK
jgi:hypothetical protein